MQEMSNNDLYRLLSELGSMVLLQTHINPRRLVEELKDFENHFKQYNPRKPFNRRFGLSLTSLDGQLSGVPDLDSLFEYNSLHGTSFKENDFKTPTPALRELTSLAPVLDAFGPHLGRSHILRLDAGGFFPSHRDSYGLNKTCFRLLIPIKHCGPSRLNFQIDSQNRFLEEGKVYFVDTALAHHLFSFKDGSLLAVFNVQICREAVTKTLTLLAEK